jgi:hypothetical protein
MPNLHFYYLSAISIAVCHTLALYHRYSSVKTSLDMSKSLSTLASIFGTIACGVTFLAMPGLSETVTVSPTIVEPVSQKDLAEGNSQLSGVSQLREPCLKSKSTKLYIQYPNGYSYYIPNTPSEYSEAIAKYRYCG